ncbi:MAG: Uncharacterized protein Greene041679_172 [Parcubacteria group bacterium Greene0416_79]|nr:MAG: Uncharacterized protein Greene041679_172 [Parcubacteria group bacterium Greene0416_79]
MDYLKHTLWPLIKVKGVHLWWTIKYGGRKNIPPELIFGQMEKSMKRFSENIEQAFRHLPADLSDHEKGEVINLMGLAKELEEKMKELEPKDKGN